MAGTYLSNGYFRFGNPINAIVRGATSIEYSSDSNSADIVTNTGDTGSTDGHSMAKVSCQNAVARSSSERKTIYQAFQNKTQLTGYYHSGSSVFTVIGTIKSCQISDKVNSPTEFSFEFSGAEQPIQ